MTASGVSSSAASAKSDLCRNKVFATKKHKNHKKRPEKAYVSFVPFVADLLWCLASVATGGHCGQALLNLFRCDVFLVRRNGPDVTEGIG